MQTMVISEPPAPLQGTIASGTAANVDRSRSGVVKDEGHERPPPQGGCGWARTWIELPDELIEDLNAEREMHIAGELV